MESTSNILRRFYTEVWEQKNLDKIADYFHPDAGQDLLIEDRAVDISEVREWMEILHGLVHGITVNFLQTIEDSAWCSAFLEISCTSSQTGKPVTVYQQIMVRQADGLFLESYPQFDLLRFFAQLHMPRPKKHDVLSRSGIA